MKKIYPLIVLLYAALISHGQITITSSDMPVSGDTARYSSSATRLNFDTTGAGITWDYSSLVANGQGIDTFQSALSINPIYGLYFGFSDYGLAATGNLAFGALNLSNVYNFYKTTSAQLEINGMGAEYTGIPLPSAYTIPDKVYQFPLSYGRMDTTPYDVSISVPGVASVHEVGTRYNSVDGWGTVITPDGSFTCIRLKSVTAEVDSLTLTAFGGFTIGIPRTATDYKWLANGIIIPVLEVSGNTQGNNFVPNLERFKDSVRFIPPQFSVHANFTASLTACTTADSVTITNRNRPNVAGSTFLYTITPATFSYLSGTSDTSHSPVVQFTAPGLYTVEQQVWSPAGGSLPATSDTIKTDYITVTPSGIQILSPNDAMLVYPNPADDHLVCMWQGSSKMVSISMTDIRGREVYTAAAPDPAIFNVPTGNLPSGDYLMIAHLSDGSEYLKKVQVIH